MRDGSQHLNNRSVCLQWKCEVCFVPSCNYLEDNDDNDNGSENENSANNTSSPQQQDSDSDDSDIVIKKKPSNANKSSADATDLFGDLSDGDDDSNDDDDEREARSIDDNKDAEERSDAEMEEGEGEPQVIERLINVEMPPVRFSLGNGLFYVRMPNFLSIDPRPFDAATYQGEGGEEEVLDEEGKTRLKMSVENTIRWQYVPSEDNPEQMKKISNARVVKWSDGSMSLHLGGEIFDIHTMNENHDHNHMYVKQGNGLVGQAVFKKKLTFRPHSTDSYTHKKMTLSMADKSSKVQQVKEMPLGRLKNPEMNKAQLIKQEEEALKATVRRENQQRRVRDRFSIRSLEQGVADDEEGVISLSSIKRNALNRSRDDDFIDDDYSSSASPSGSDDDDDFAASLSATAKKSKKRRLLVDDD